MPYQFIGTGSGSGLGFSVSAAGDVDLDGTVDLLIGGRDGAYLVAAADLEFLDTLDGKNDGFILTQNIHLGQSSFEFTGPAASGIDAGFFVASAGNADGSGGDDLLIGVNISRTSFLVAADDLIAADGNGDGRIDVADIAQGNSYQLVDLTFPGFAGYTVSSAGDVDGDGLKDLLIGSDTASDSDGQAFLVLAADLRAADIAGSIDGITTDNQISLADINLGGSYRFNLVEPTQTISTATTVTNLQNADGTGEAGLLIGGYAASVGGLSFSEAYLISDADLVFIDGQDGALDNTIDLDNVAMGPGSYIFSNTNPAGTDGQVSVASAGNTDGVGGNDILLGFNSDPPNFTGQFSSQVFLVTEADFRAADVRDGTEDGMVDLAQIDAANGSYQFNISSPSLNAFLVSVSSAGDFDNDGLDDLLIGTDLGEGRNFSGEVHLISSADLGALDISDSPDGVIDLSTVEYSGTSSYRLTGVEGLDLTGSSVTSVEQLDGTIDVLIGSTFVGGADEGRAHLLGATPEELSALDRADGILDNTINLANVRQDSQRTIDVAEENTTSNDTVDFLGDPGGLPGEQIQLTADASGQRGVVFLNEKVSLNEDFSFAAGLNFGTNQSSTVPDIGADGIAIVLHNDPDGVNAQGGGGGLMGAAGIQNGIAIEFDTFFNFAEIDFTGEIAADHTALYDTDGLNAPYATGSQLTPATALPELETGMEFPVTINWAAETRSLSWTIAGVSQSRSFSEAELDQLLTDERSVFFGFTSTTGSGSNLQVLDNAELTATFVCFCRDTLIDTSEGEVPIQNLSVGDLVTTLDHGYQPIQWIGSSHRLAAGNCAPIQIQAGTLENRRDLYVSPQHRILLRHWRNELLFGEMEVLATAKSLINGTSIRRQEGGEVEYFHILCERHEILFAEGAPTESLYPGCEAWQTLHQSVRQEILRLFPKYGINAKSYGPMARMCLKSFEGALVSRLLSDPNAYQENLRRFGSEYS